MEYLLIAVVSCLTALLTFFSGFGLGTILMPVFAIFFPIEIAIALTAIVHLVNNIFKISLVWRNIDLHTVALFAIPASIMAFIGALLLKYISTDIIIYQYQIGESIKEISLIKLIIAALLIAFAVIEINKKLSSFSFSRKYISLGGALSGFFGGLSGHQGALRSMFLLRSGLNKEAFIATSIASAVVIDISRLTVYGSSFFTKHFTNISDNKAFYFVIIACLSAFIGSFFGRRVLKKITMRSVQLIVGIMIVVLAILLASGLI